MIRVAALIALVVFAACGGNEAAPVDPAPFKAAMEAEIAKKKYGVSVDAIEDLVVSGDTAVAGVRVSHKESTGMRPRWGVSFTRVGGTWQVERVDK